MTRYLLDTNIISNVIKPQPSESLLAWMAAQLDEDLFIASLTVAEILRGILEKPRGKKRDALDVWFSGPEGPQALFAGRILSFDDKAGLIWARLMAEGKAAGRRNCSEGVMLGFARGDQGGANARVETDFLVDCFGVGLKRAGLPPFGLEEHRADQTIEQVEGVIGQSGG